MEFVTFEWVENLVDKEMLLLRRAIFILISNSKLYVSMVILIASSANTSFI